MEKNYDYWKEVNRQLCTGKYTNDVELEDIMKYAIHKLYLKSFIQNLPVVAESFEKTLTQLERDTRFTGPVAVIPYEILEAKLFTTDNEEFYDGMIGGLPSMEYPIIADIVGLPNSLFTEDIYHDTVQLRIHNDLTQPGVQSYSELRVCVYSEVVTIMNIMNEMEDTKPEALSIEGYHLIASFHPKMYTYLANNKLGCTLTTPLKSLLSNYLEINDFSMDEEFNDWYENNMNIVIHHLPSNGEVTREYYNVCSDLLSATFRGLIDFINLYKLSSVDAMTMNKKYKLVISSSITDFPEGFVTLQLYAKDDIVKSSEYAN